MAVTRVEITSRTPFARGESFGDVGPYEQLDGVIYFAVDPEHPANSTITDLTLAPGTGMVWWSSHRTFVSSSRLTRPGGGNGSSLTY